jgi:hypothetical protein
LADNRAAVNIINDGSETARTQRFQQAQLAALGYEISLIEATQNDLENSYSSTNAIPFIDKRTGERKIIYPVFPGETKEDFKNYQSISENDLQGKGLKAFATYKQLGYTPIPVRDFSHIVKGNTHCISNVLAKRETDFESEISA